MRYEPLFRPLALNGCTIPNRLVRTAHSTGATGDALIRYHEDRARAGTALTILQTTPAPSKRSRSPTL